MNEIRVRSKITKYTDVKGLDFHDRFPKFVLDKDKLDKDIKRIQYAMGSKTEADCIEKGDLIRFSCESEEPHYKKEDLYLIVGKNLYSEAFEQAVIGHGIGSFELTLESVKVLVRVKEIIRTRIPALTDENVKTWGIEGVDSVEALRRYCFGRQVDNFRDDDEEAEMLSSLIFMESVNQSEFELDEEEQLCLTRSMGASMGIGFSDADEEVSIDMEELMQSMILGTLKAAAVGYKLCLEKGMLYTMDDYQHELERRTQSRKCSIEEVKDNYSPMDFGLEFYAEYFFNEMDSYVGQCMKDYYYKENNKPDVYDVAIVGAGPAGLSAALTLKLHKKSILWFGRDTLSDKVEKSEKIANYAGFEPISGTELNAAFRKQMKTADLELTDKMVTQITKNRDYYMLLADNEIYKAKTVLLTVGSVPAKGIRNEMELLGHGVSYCATCDGFLYKGKSIAVFCGSKRYEHEVAYLAEIADTVYLYAKYEDCEINLPNVVKLNKAMTAVIGEEKVSGIELSDGEQILVDGAFFLRNSVAPATILKGLLMDGAHIAVNRACETNMEGCYAAGDCTGRPYQIAKAVGEGNVAAHGIVKYLAEEK